MQDNDPAASEPAPVRPLQPAPLGSTGLPSNVCSTLAVMIPLVGGIVFLFLERKDKLVRFHSIQSIVLGVLLGAAYLMESFVAMIFKPIPFLGPLVMTVAGVIYGVFALAWLVVYFIALYKAFCGKAWAIPYFGPIFGRFNAL